MDPLVLPEQPSASPPISATGPTNPVQRLAGLDAVLEEVWRQLVLAPKDKAHAWRTPVLATRDGDGVDARSVILREAREAERELMVYTDLRSGKVRQLLAHPAGVLVMWSPALSWQLRCQVRLGVEASGLDVTSRWAQLKLSPAAQDYLSPLPPGAVLGDAPPPGRADLHSDEQAFFGVITAQVQSIDWLELGRQGHRRARFDAQGARWLQP